MMHITFNQYLCRLKKIAVKLDFEEKDLDKIIIVGDRVLIRPRSPQDRTASGLYLPPTVTEKEQIRTGYVMKVGPGYPIPAIPEAEEPWRDPADEVKYVPLQPRDGDKAVFLQTNAWEIEFNKEKFFIVPQSAILLLVRDEEILR